MSAPISDLDFLAFDTETTGLYPSSEALVEIAAVRFNLASGAKEYFQTLVHPARPIPAQATAIHGIKDEHVANAPSLDQVLPKFFAFIAGAIPVAHNAAFDLGFLSLHSLRLGMQLPDIAVLDSCMFARRVFPEEASHKLESLVKSLGIGESTFHRALADAKSCMELFRITVEKSCGAAATWEDLLKRHGPAGNFRASAPKALTTELLSTPWAPLLNAMERRHPIWIQYEGNFGPREVTPLLIYAKGAKQYLEATCHLDGIRKNFRLDKILKIFPHGQARSSL